MTLNVDNTFTLHEHRESWDLNVQFKFRRDSAGTFEETENTVIFHASSVIFRDGNVALEIGPKEFTATCISIDNCIKTDLCLQDAIPLGASKMSLERDYNLILESGPIKVLLKNITHHVFILKPTKELLIGNLN